MTNAADGTPIAEDLREMYIACRGVEGWGLPIPHAADRAKELIERISRAEERERVLREALERIKAAVGTSTEAWHIADAALAAGSEGAR